MLKTTSRMLSGFFAVLTMVNVVMMLSQPITNFDGMRAVAILAGIALAFHAIATNKTVDAFLKA